MTLYDPAVTAVQFNLIGSHDTPRARTVHGRRSAARLRLATLLQLTLPGDAVDLLRRRARDGGRGRSRLPAGLSAGRRGAGRRRGRDAGVRPRGDRAPGEGTWRSGAARRASRPGPRWVVLERTAEGRRAIVAVNAGDEAGRP